MVPAITFRQDSPRGAAGEKRLLKNSGTWEPHAAATLRCAGGPAAHLGHTQHEEENQPHMFHQAETSAWVGQNNLLSSRMSKRYESR